MNIDWTGDRCIICLETLPLTSEHIIPSSIGGVLTCNFLCKNCNSKLGSEVEASMRSDPTIRLAVDHIRDANPTLANKLEENQPFLVHSVTGKEPAYIQNNKFQIHPRVDDDGSYIQSPDIARSTITNILKRSEVSPHEVQVALEKFDNSELNTKNEIHPNLEVITWAGEKAELDLSKSELANPLIPLKIAFEFLALHLGNDIYADAHQLQELRNILLTCEQSSECFKVERLMAKSYKPLHGLLHEGNEPYTTIQIRLFGILAFRVHFLKISVNGPRFIYTHDLGTGEEYVSDMVEGSIL
jgi:HNH endonuclease